MASRAVPADLEATLIELYPALVRRLTLVIGDEAEAQDVAQEAFIRASRGRHRFDGRDPRAWFWTIGLRLASNEMRRRRRFGSAPDDSAAALATDGGPTWAMSVDPDLWSALAALDRRTRAALLLNVLDGYTHAEIAAMLGVRPGTVSSWLSRGKERLREALTEA
jgi:RNA polymerase sigma-70 factor (ECF subfamily)